MITRRTNEIVVRLWLTCVGGDDEVFLASDLPFPGRTLSSREDGVMPSGTLEETQLGPAEPLGRKRFMAFRVSKPPARFKHGDLQHLDVADSRVTCSGASV
jgi:hypothetical protein